MTSEEEKREKEGEWGGQVDGPYISVVCKYSGTPRDETLMSVTQKKLADISICIEGTLGMMIPMQLTNPITY